MNGSTPLDLRYDRPMITRCAPTIAIVPLLATTLVGCGPQIELETAETGGSGEPTATSAPATATGPDTVDPDSSGGPVATQREVDIIFVIDNSGSMAEEQAKIATSIGNLVGALDTVEPPVDYRIAVTTTDNGNPWCPGSSPEAGGFVATSCRSRLTEFVFEGAELIDATEEACLSLCGIEELALPNPWIDVDNTNGTNNVPGGAVIDALRCMLPQGIDGCGFEQPLESAHKAIVRTMTAGTANNGFRRDGALLTVVLVTDEADCSHNQAWETIFSPEGNRVFWSDVDAPAPTSALCWNAGVECTGSGNPYDECHVQDYDLNGELARDPLEDAVLRPIVRYTALLAGEGAFVVSINGVGADGFPTYANATTDPQYQNTYGIGPGCSSTFGDAVPPVRVRDVIASVSGADNQYSICSPGFETTMSSIASGILARLP